MVDALIARLAPRCTAPRVDAYATDAHALTAATHAASMYVDAPSVALAARERQLAECARQG